ncbi:hypothetical protein ACHAWF_015182 [Thalassiosira exigua]
MASSGDYLRIKTRGEPLPYLQRMREEQRNYFERMEARKRARKFASLSASSDDSSQEGDREPLPYLQWMRAEQRSYFERMEAEERARKFASLSDASARDGAEGNEGGMC